MHDIVIACKGFTLVPTHPCTEYEYMEDLLQLHSMQRPKPVEVPPVLMGNSTPLREEEWRARLQEHPDTRLKDYVLRGIQEGFRVGYDYRNHKCKRVKDNLRSALEHPDVVCKYIAEECADGRLLGPFSPDSLPAVQVSRFGVIPKSTPGKWRLILDLSSPEGNSVNDGINPELCSLSYVSVDDAARTVAGLGRGALLAKVDIKSAYRMVPVHPEDRMLLGMVWDGALYVDATLPFGLRSAPKIFNTLADVIEWILKQEGIDWVFHYLDDFLVIGAPSSDQCARQLQTLLAVFDKLNVPVAVEKLEGPATILIFLGIELDTQALTLRLPVDKLTELKLLINSWTQKRACTKKDLQSLVGKLQHACKVVRPGRSFLRRMFELLKGVSRKQHFIRLNKSFHSDLRWWQLFLSSWNGVAMIGSQEWSPAFHLYSDASGSFGCGAWWDQSWLQIKWPRDLQDWAIAAKELFPIVVAAMVWGKRWAGQSIMVHCDNQAVVEVVNSGYCKDPIMMQLIRCLFFISARFEISLRAIHIPGHLNTGADAISRNNLPLFHSQVPRARPAPTPIPHALMDLLAHQRPDWTSPRWSQLFKTCLLQV